MTVSNRRFQTRSVPKLKTKPTNNQPTPNERLYSVSELCSIARLPPEAVFRLFSNEPDALLFLLVPESLATRVFGEYDEDFKDMKSKADQPEELYPSLFPAAAKRGWMP